MIAMPPLPKAPPVGLAVVLFALLPISQDQAPPQRPQFGATITRVRVDVIVADDEGRFVDNLTARDFRLFEDERLQEILDVQLIDITARKLVELGRPPRDAAGSENGAARPAAPGAAPAPVPPIATAPLEAEIPADAIGDYGSVVFLIDFPNLGPQWKARFATYWENWLERTESVDLPWSVYVIDSLRRLRELTPPTQSIERLRDVAAWVRNVRLIGRTPTDVLFAEAVAEQEARMRGEPGLGEPAVGEPVVGEPAIGETALPSSAEAADAMLAAAGGSARRLDAALETVAPLERFTERLSGRRGRTALVWVTSGRAPALAQQRIYRAANTANVSIYILDPGTRTDMGAGLLDASRTRLPRGDVLSDMMLNILDRQDIARGRFFDRAEALDRAAQRTGGKALTNWFDIGEVLGDIENDTSRYYLLTYAPPEPHGDGAYHNLRVEIRRPGLSVRAREGYIDYAETEREGRVVGALRGLPRTTSDLPLHTQTYRTWDEEGGPVVIVLSSVDAREVVTTQEDGSHWVRVGIVGQVRGDDGETISELEELIERSLDADPSLQPEVAFITHQCLWRAEPGSHVLALAALDLETGRTGVTRQALEVPDPEASGWRVSDLMLADASNLDEPRFVVQGRVAADTAIAAYVEVFGGMRPILIGRLRAIRPEDDQGAPRQPVWSVGRPGVALEAEGSLHRGALALPTSLPPGDYSLAVDVIDAGNRQRTLRAQFRVLSPPPGEEARF